MPFVSELLTPGTAYTRKDLGELLGYGHKALERGLFTPKRYASVLIFITRDKAAHMTPYVDELDGDDLRFDSELQGRLDGKVIEHGARGLELLLFYRESPKVPFRYEGPFFYVDHTPGPPNRIHLRRVSAPERAVPAAAGPQASFAVIANPNVYDAEGASRAEHWCTWMLPTGEVRPGETFAIWRTRGRDGRRGVVAFGRVVTEAGPRPPMERTLRFWSDPPALDALERRFVFEFLSAPNLPLWLDEDSTGTLERLSVSRAQGNKRYAVSVEDWDALVALAGGLVDARPPEQAPTPPRAPARQLAAPVSASPTERPAGADLVGWFVEHIRAYGSVSEAEATLRAGGPRGYRALRRELDRQGVPIVSQATPGGMIWRLREES